VASNNKWQRHGQCMTATTKKLFPKLQSTGGNDDRNVNQKKLMQRDGNCVSRHWHWHQKWL